MHPHRKLTVWQKAHELVVATYHSLAASVDPSRADLASELRRVTLRVSTDIAEGAAQRDPHEFQMNLYYAMDALMVVDTLVLVAGDVGAISRSDQAKLEARLDELHRMLSSLRSSVQKRAAAADRREKDRRVAAAATRPKRGAPEAEALPYYDPFAPVAEDDGGEGGEDPRGGFGFGGGEPDGTLVS